MTISIDQLKDKLTDQQAKAAHLLVTNEFVGKDKKSQDELADEIGVSRQTLHNWRFKNPEFIKYQKALSSLTLDSYRAEADAQLLKLIRGTSNNGIPSVKGLELMYKLSGDLVNKSEVVTTESENYKPRMTREEASEELKKLTDSLH